MLYDFQTLLIILMYICILSCIPSLLSKWAVFSDPVT